MTAIIAIIPIHQITKLHILIHVISEFRLSVIKPVDIESFVASVIWVVFHVSSVWIWSTDVIFVSQIYRVCPFKLIFEYHSAFDVESSFIEIFCDWFSEFMAHWKLDHSVNDIDNDEILSTIISHLMFWFIKFRVTSHQLLPCLPRTAHSILRKSQLLFIISLFYNSISAVVFVI